MDGRAILTITTVITIGSSATISESDKENKVSLYKWNYYSPSVNELKNLIKHIQIFSIPAFQKLYDTSGEIQHLTNKKMKGIKKRIKKSKNSFSVMKKILFYLKKYLKQVEDLKYFNLVTDSNVLDSTVATRKFIIKNFEDKLSLAIFEISENTELGQKETNYIRRKKDKNMPLFRFKESGSFSYMMLRDNFFFNHIEEFLLYGIEILHQKKRYEQKNRKRRIYPFLKF